MKLTSVAAITSLIATVGAEIVHKVVNNEFDYCSKKEIKMAGSMLDTNKRDLSVLSVCDDQTIVESYTCERSECAFKTVPAISDQPIKNFDTVLGTQNYAVAYSTATNLHIAIGDHDRSMSVPVDNANSVSIIEKNPTTYFMIWSEGTPSKVHYKLVSAEVSGTIIEEVFTKQAFEDEDVSLSFPRAVFVKKHNVFLVTAVDDKNEHVGFLIDADNGIITKGLVDISYTLLFENIENYDITLLTDGVTVAITRMTLDLSPVTRAAVKLNAVRVVAPDNIDVRFNQAQIDFPEEDNNSIFHLPRVEVTSLSTNNFIAAFHSGSSFKFFRGFISDAPVGPVGTSIEKKDSGELPFAVADAEKLRFDLANINSEKGIAMAYTDGEEVFAFSKDDIRFRPVTVTNPPSTESPTVVPTGVPTGAPLPVTKSPPVLELDPKVDTDDDMADWAIALLVTGCVVLVVLVITLVCYNCRSHSSDDDTAVNSQKESEKAATTININHQLEHHPVNALPEN
eukprot:TRINITY_DN3687_c0_g3_i1.p1 TRINITY_DN3687_c0_g3~~TRINITY_DN3687_c0_g3_i1.p1  ORF type:complete len:510 (+),score=126.32 TRINITY_DN3687_c0_g3_i1:71-1600(+)